MKRTYRKAERMQFQKQTAELIVELGGTPDPQWNPQNKDESPHYVLKTSVGILRLTVSNHDYPPSLGTLFGQFDDVDRLPSWLGVGSNGKWNHHLFTNWTLENWLTYLRSALTQLLTLESWST